MSILKPALQKKITNLYPDKIVNNLKVVDSDLYEELVSIAKKEGMSLKDLLEGQGYSYVKKSIIQMYVEDYLDLKRIFEDNPVDSLHERDNKLYYKLLNHAKIKKISLKQYIGMLGFQYELKKENLQSNEIEKELSKIYKNKVVKNLSTINPSLYYKAYQYAQKEGQTIKDFIESLGFTLETKETKDLKQKSKGKSLKRNPLSKISNKQLKNTNNSTGKKRGRPRKNILSNEMSNVENSSNENQFKEETVNSVSNSNSLKRKPGRPKKNVTVENLEETKNEKTLEKVNTPVNANIQGTRKPGRPKKNVENNENLKEVK